MKDITKRIGGANPGPRIVAAILVGCAVLLSPAPGRPQAPPSAAPGADPILPSAPPVPGSGGGAVPDGSVSSDQSGLPTLEGLRRSWSGPPGQPKGPKTFWETVWPTIVPYPRTGNFYIAPSGPGYYTLYDYLAGSELPERPSNPYLQWGQNANPFFNVDFRYLDNPNNTETFLFDSLKRIHLGDDWLFSTGGEMRDRYTSLGKRLPIQQETAGRL